MLEIIVLLASLATRVDTTPFAALAAQAVPVAPISIKSSLEFDVSGLDTDGLPTTVTLAEVALTSSTLVDLNVGGAIVKMISQVAAIGPNSVPLASLITTPAGTGKIWCRVKNSLGAYSAYSLLPSTVSWAAGKPAAPAGLKISVTITTP